MARKAFYLAPYGYAQLGVFCYTSGVFHYAVNADQLLCIVANLEGETLSPLLHRDAGEGC